MNKGLGFRDSEASIVVESAIAWVLCLLRLLGAHALCYFSQNKDLSESFFEFCLRAYRYYAYYVPAEVMLSVISLLSFSRHICWIHKQREGGVTFCL